MAATSLAVSPLINLPCMAQSAGIMKEWTTDMDIDADSKPDQDVSEAIEDTENSDVCIPIGEGENCW